MEGMDKNGFSIQGWNNKQFANEELYARKIGVIYDATMEELSILAARSAPDPENIFSFDSNSFAKAKSKQLLLEMASNVTALIDDGAAASWILAAQKTQELVYYHTTNVPKAQVAASLPRNIDGFKGFQSRKYFFDLSERVWNITQQFKQEMELAVDVALLEGKSAQRLSQDIRPLLKEPNKLFRRVRDKRGVLQLSKAAAAYHPGQGVYRSSYKNAMRVARTEINMAYRASDHYRWAKLDIIVGYRINLSNNPNHCPMCEALAGDYPKQFKFTGWHPHCRCYVTSILASAEERRAISKAMIRGESTEGLTSKNNMQDMPENYKSWTKENQDRLLNARKPPYFVIENYTGRKLENGLTFPTNSASNTGQGREQNGL